MQLIYASKREYVVFAAALHNSTSQQKGRFRIVGKAMFYAIFITYQYAMGSWPVFTYIRQGSFSDI